MIAYLMKHKGMTLQEAYMHLKKLRPVCKPKKNFLRQLMKYEKRLRSEDASEEKSCMLVRVLFSKFFCVKSASARYASPRFFDGALKTN